MSEQETLDAQRILLQYDKPFTKLEDYLEVGGFEALKQSLKMEPMEIIGIIKKSFLRGRGGAGFPAGIKWDGVRNNPIGAHGAEPKRYLVCNFSEGEPGTYKDRFLVQKNPYALIEGMMIASYAIDTINAIICIKIISQREIAILERAIEECRQAGFLGDNVLDSGHDFPLEIAIGPDSYLLGEDRAQLEVIEGKPAWPRAKGIIPVFVGLYDQPTCVNNVETLSTVPYIIRNGPDWFKSIGTADSPGTMIFTLTGDVKYPGMYELPLGTPLSTLINTYGGGPLMGRHIQAVFSGPTNAVIPADKLDTPLDYGSMRKIPSGLGSGGYIVLDNTACVLTMGLNFSKFLALESCGQCTSCKAGTGRITRGLELLEAGEATEETVMAILDDCQHIKGSGHCYLCTEEGIEIGSIFYNFPEVIVEHLEYGCLKDRHLVMPKIKSFEQATNTFTFDVDYFKNCEAQGKTINYPGG